MKIAGTLYLIPSAGVTAANTAVYVNGVAAQNLAASTVYLVTLFNNAGTLTVDFLTTVTHAADTVAGNQGVEIKTGDNTRSVIGLLRTDGSSQFGDFLTLSWFNRRPKVQTTAFTTTRTTASTSYTEVHSEIRNSFLVWSGETALTTLEGAVSDDTVNKLALTSIGFDGAVAEDTFNFLYTNAGGGSYAPIGLHFPKSGLSEGYHYATVAGMVDGGTGSWYVNANSAGKRTSLTVMVQG